MHRSKVSQARELFLPFILICMIVVFSSKSAMAEDQFFTVERDGVIHKFAKTDTNWLDSFLEKSFNRWEYDTFEVFQQVADKEGVAIDIGAWMGTTCIWLSKNFANVIAVEADKESVNYLKKNLEASNCKNVIICDKALTGHGKPVVFGARLEMIHGDALNGSTSFVKEATNAKCDYLVDSITFKDIVEQYVKPNCHHREITFIKCDIEGGEEPVLEDLLNFAYDHHCKVWMSFHCRWWTNKKISDFSEVFKKFDANCPNNDVIDYVTKQPFASVLFIPKRLISIP